MIKYIALSLLGVILLANSSESLTNPCTLTSIDIPAVTEKVSQIKQLIVAARDEARRSDYSFVRNPNLDLTTRTQELMASSTKIEPLLASAGITFDVGPIVQALTTFLGNAALDSTSTQKEKNIKSAEFATSTAKIAFQQMYDGGLAVLAPMVGITEDQLRTFVENSSQTVPLGQTCAVNKIRTLKRVLDLTSTSMDVLLQNLTNLINSMP